MQSSNQNTYGPAQSLNPYPVMPMPASSPSTWTPQNDETLLSARARGMNWQSIQQQFFPTKTSNACRKRHERLITAKIIDDWECEKMKELAAGYMGMREKIWKPLADQIGEKWTAVEAKCMGSGIKTLQWWARHSNKQTEMHSEKEHHFGDQNDSEGRKMKRLAEVICGVNVVFMILSGLAAFLWKYFMHDFSGAFGFAGWIVAVMNGIMVAYIAKWQKE